MADISKLSRLVGGLQRHLTLSDNTLVVDNLKVKMGSGNDANHATFAGTLTAARTITMPDANVNLGNIAANTSDIADLRTTTGTADGDTSMGTFTGTIIADSVSTKAGMQALETDLEALQTSSGIAAEATHYGTFTGTTIPDSSTAKGAFQALETSVELKANDTDVIKKNGSVAFTADQSMGGFKLTSLGNGTASGDAVNKAQLDAVTSLIQNLEWQDSAIDYIIDNTAVPPTEVSGDRYVLSAGGGAPHANWDGATAGDIVEFNGTIWTAVTPTTGMFISVDDENTVVYYWGGASWGTKSFEATTASTGLVKVGFDIRLDSSSAGTGLGFSAGVLSVNVDDVGVEINADTLRLKDLGVTTAKLAATSVTAAKLGSDVAGTGMTGGNGSALAIDFGVAGSKAISATDLAATTTGKGASLIGVEDAGANYTATTVEGVLTEIDGRLDTLEAATSSSSLSESLPAGETLTAGIRALRWGRTGDAETAGRVYFAQKTPSLNDGTDDKFHVMGVAIAAGETAGTSLSVIKAGPITATAHGFTVGLPVYLNNATGGLTSTAPTAAGDSVVKVGMARDANTIEVQIQIMGVN